MIATKILKRGGLALALSALTLATTATLSPASAAPTYWEFKNTANGKCLTGSATTTAVWVSTCNDGQQQQWDWVGSNTYKLLKNRASGRCLTSDSKSLNNAVWTSSPCDSSVNGQLWWFSGNDTKILADRWSDWLRTSPSGSDAVYATSETSTYADWAEWTGYHT